MRTVRTLKLLAPLALISVLSLSWTFAKTADPVVEVPVKTLEPTPQHTSLDQTIAKLLSQHHYRQSKLDDRLSALILNTYLDDLDFGRVYFLAGDIADFEQYRNTLDDALKSGNLQPAYEMFNVCLLYTSRCV